MNARMHDSWRRILMGGLVPLVLLGGVLVQAPSAAAQERPTGDRLASVRMDSVAHGYVPGGSLGFVLRETPLAEQLYRRGELGQPSLLWTAQFTSRWALTDDQLDRWSAQVSGLVTDELGADVRLAGWERLNASDVGDRRIAYRYTLANASGQPIGEATVLVFAQGDQVGMTAAAALGGPAPIDASGLARLMAVSSRG